MILIFLLTLTGSVGVVSSDDPPPEVRRRVAALNDEGIALYGKGEYVRAIERFEAALELHAGSDDIRTNLGKSHAAYGLHLVDGVVTTRDGSRALRKALDRLSLSLLYWRGDGKTHRAIAWCQYELGELPAAERSLEISVGVDPESFETWRLLGVVREEQEKFEEAFLAYEKALAIRPRDTALVTRLKRARYDRQAMTEFRSLKTERFTIYYPSQITLAVSERIRATLDKTFDSFVRRWDLADPRGVVVICYPPGEFSSRTGFHEDVGGAFDGRIRVAFPSELEDGGLTVDRVVRHEAIHLLLHSAGASPPRWLDEGVAQYFDGEERSRWWPQFRKALKAAPNVGLLDRERRFDHADRASWSVLYLHSFFFVKHLVKIGSEFRLDMVVREVRQGRRWGVAVESVYGSSASELDRKWRRTVLEAPESQ